MPHGPLSAEPLALPRWKRLASYLSDIRLLRLPGSELPAGTGDAALPPLELLLRDGRLMLCTPDAVYSYEDRYTSFAGALADLPPPWHPRRVLVAGFGLGSIAGLLQKRGSKPLILGLDNDERVLDLARRYAAGEWRQRCTLLGADALSWIASSRERFDLVALDLFVGARVPERASEPQFLQRARSLLHPGGWVLFSRLNEEPQAEREAFEQAVRRAWPGCTAARYGGNTVYAWRAPGGHSSQGA
jgi:SAM-dependent methyltransferase